MRNIIGDQKLSGAIQDGDTADSTGYIFDARLANMKPMIVSQNLH